jgi:hypothetical protein
LNESLAFAEEFNNVSRKIQTGYFMADLAVHQGKFVSAARLLIVQVNNPLALLLECLESSFTNWLVCFGNIHPLPNVPM